MVTISALNGRRNRDTYRYFRRDTLFCLSQNGPQNASAIANWIANRENNTRNKKYPRREKKYYWDA